VSWYNAGHETSKILVPLVDQVFPAATDDPSALGDRSVQVLFGASLLVLALTVAEHVAALRQNPGPPAP
jgi:hypothetical protein